MAHGGIVTGEERAALSVSRGGSWRQHKVIVLCASFLSAMVLFCVVAPWLLPHAYDAQDLTQIAQAPSPEYWLGTDLLGRDLLVRIAYGGRVSLGIGFSATAVALLIGLLYGVVAGYVGGRLDALMMRVIEIVYALPFTIFVILMMVLFGQSLWLLFLSIAAVEWMTVARIMRGQVLILRQQSFVEASAVLGQSPVRLVWRHIVPNVLPLLLVYGSLMVPSVMLLEAFISFLGLGVKAPQSSWGLLIKEGAEVLEEFPWMLLFPALFFSSTLLALNFLGDYLRDLWDPKSR